MTVIFQRFEILWRDQARGGADNVSVAFKLDAGIESQSATQKISVTRLSAARTRVDLVPAGGKYVPISDACRRARRRVGVWEGEGGAADFFPAV